MIKLIFNKKKAIVKKGTIRFTISKIVYSIKVNKWTDFTIIDKKTLRKNR